MHTLDVKKEFYKGWTQKYKEGSLLLVHAIESVNNPKGNKPTKKVMLDVLAVSEENENLSDFEKRIKHCYNRKNEFFRMNLYVYSMRPNNPIANPLYPNAEMEIKKKFLELPG